MMNLLHPKRPMEHNRLLPNMVLLHPSYLCSMNILVQEALKDEEEKDEEEDDEEEDDEEEKDVGINI